MAAHPITFEPVYDMTFCFMGVCSWWFDCPWCRCWCHAYHICSLCFLICLVHGYCYILSCFVLVVVLALIVVGVVLGALLLFCLFWRKFLCSILCNAHAGYMHFVKTFCMCCTSVLRSSAVEETAFSLCVKVFMMLYIAPMWWWLTQCRYQLVFMGEPFLFVDSSCLVTRY